ncbi:exodeoxyribonuclease I [Vespertiliibacter pulmonis]|uniref:Exodeoxyribonuclease I n=1 Tax=Vespertiliibacter pulmonis TaxID=1443036 RepID=A0A3N4WJ86_9PAST|nr:exodeoxyribonuclease I [Vespertiliibacter pulmonis]QLB21569.1 exodeoxyribonuclease I [Vespertiliibacter pulmonis]RPE85990.1 exodeoxyribonuclease I subunit C [Vespertiliibacter pulmonis]
MHQPTFFIYDFESFGIHPAKDRPAQFAGIRTDSEFNIIGEPVMFYCKQTPDYLPSPEAVMVTGITPQLCNEQGVSEPEFSARIHHEFSQPNTCIMGYNNIRYDDEMTRYTFFRNFFDPYEYSYKNGNSRWDLLDVVRACYALRPDGIEWAFDENGLPNFKLENLTKANGIAHENAHDAMADVYATIAMAKLIKQKQPKLFQFFFDNRGKKAIEAMIDVGEMTPLVHVSGMLGNYRGNTAWIAPLAWHPTNQNAVIVCDLAGNIDGLLHEPAQLLRERLYTPKSELEEQGIASVPLKLVHINKCPILAPAKTLLPENAERLGIDRPACLANLKLLKENKSVVREKVIEIFAEDRTFDEPKNVEQSLYQGFFSTADKNNMAILRELPPEQLANHALKFADPRVEPLLFHYRARHYSETLTRAEQIRWQKWCHQQIDEQADAFSEAIDRLFQEHFDNPEKAKLLEELTAYAGQLAENFPKANYKVQENSQSQNLLNELNDVVEKSADKQAKFEALNVLFGKQK